MNVVKICVMERDEELIRKLIQEKKEIHIQRIDNSRYFQWLRGLNTMPWSCIMDIFCDESIEAVCDYAEEIAGKINIWNVTKDKFDIYVTKQLTYKKPVDNSEIITSCYLWNYENDSSVRREKMEEHFLLEQNQKYYDYVSFQSVEKCITEESRNYDFFFESHVSNKNGINEIYSKPALENMREHSKAFLNVESRLLSFGEVEFIVSGFG